MGRKRSTRQLLIDKAEANEASMEVIIGRIELVLGAYQDDALEHTLEVASALEAAYLFRDVVKRLTEIVKSI